MSMRPEGLDQGYYALDARSISIDLMRRVVEAHNSRSRARGPRT